VSSPCLAEGSSLKEKSERREVHARGGRQTPSLLTSPSQVPLYDRYKALDVEDQSKDDVDDSPSTPEVSPRSERPTTSITTTSTRKKRQVIVVGDSLLKGTEGSICQEDPPFQKVSCLPGAWVKDIPRKLPSLVRPSDYYPLLFFPVGGNEATMHSPRAIKSDFKALGKLVRESGAHYFFLSPFSCRQQHWKKQTGPVY